MAAKKKTSRRYTTTGRKKTPLLKEKIQALKKSGAKGKSKPQSKSPKGAPKQAPSPIQTGISADRKMEIVGVILAVVGLLTLLTIASSARSEASGFWVNLWRTSFGWGAFVLPLVLIAVGVWMVAHNFERVPQISVERLLGILFLVMIALALLHLAVSPPGRASAYAVARDGRGGGYVGAAIMVVLESGLGALGMLIALFGWFLISMAMTLDASVIDLFRWVPPLVLRIQDSWDERRAGSTGLPAYQPDLIPEIPLPDLPPHSLAPALPREAAPEQTDIPAPQADAGMVPNSEGQTVEEKKEWALPKLQDMLDEGIEATFNDDHDRQRAQVIEETLASLGAPAHVVEINRGPTITQFGVEPAFLEGRSGRTRVRVNKITSLADDLSLALAASRIRIQAPVPGKGFVGIEVPNDQIAVVALRDVAESKAFTRLRSSLRFAIGQDVAGNAVAADLGAMPHLLVAGATGTGKSVFVNALIIGLLLHNTPATLRFVMVDPKRVELTGYNGIPHLLAPVVTEIDRVVGVLQWVTREMDSRYKKFADVGARNIADFNKRAAAEGGSQLPYLVLVIDELADMMMVAPDQTERLITRMAQLARATGIHLVISTQRPSVDVVTGLIKANFPARIAFAVASGTDSRVILDQPGAERLLGRGDMLFQAPDAPSPARMQGVFVSDPEIQRVVQYWRSFAGSTSMAPVATSTPADAPPQGVPLKQIPIWEEMKEEEDEDNLYEEALDIIRRQGRASISMLQRRLKIGYTRAARLIDMMEENGVIGPATGTSQPRDILDYGQAAPPAGEE